MYTDVSTVEVIVANWKPPSSGMLQVNSNSPGTRGLQSRRRGIVVNPLTSLANPVECIVSEQPSNLYPNENPNCAQIFFPPYVGAAVVVPVGPGVGLGVATVVVGPGVGCDEGGGVGLVLGKGVGPGVGPGVGDGVHTMQHPSTYVGLHEISSSNMPSGASLQQGKSPYVGTGVGDVVGVKVGPGLGL